MREKEVSRVDLDKLFYVVQHIHTHTLNIIPAHIEQSIISFLKRLRSQLHSSTTPTTQIYIYISMT
jgi:hypothetical protein